MMGRCANSTCLSGGIGAGELFTAVNQHMSNLGACKKKSCNFRCTASIKESKKVRLLMPWSICLPPHLCMQAERADTTGCADAGTLGAELLLARAVLQDNRISHMGSVRQKTQPMKT